MRRPELVLYEVMLLIMLYLVRAFVYFLFENGCSAGDSVTTAVT